ncbi:MULTISPECIES: NAD(+) synthase [Paenibacillus]|jgi:NAD+ synthase (glutamine-hydrolysing)|uniref:NAD(+) synthase n=1 Tax=Paenibacillus TaxID=44249 RepID=UPI0004F7CCD3|nr:MULTISPECIES: NAD(+) synthase [unclassified Paenibacillus]AIQ31103.1 NAD synthetase [Paenibacillus sp. FSL P4-0081]OMF25547.1 NAD(+) synthase [Paenibacillus sp. FSL H8-0259]
MQNHGFARVAAASPELKVADCVFNSEQIIEVINNAAAQEVEYLVLPELCITGYTCADLFLQPRLLDAATEALLRITAATAEHTMIVIAGLPISIKSRLFNCAAVIQQGHILGIVVKTCIPGYSEFYEPRWFAGAEELEVSELRIGGAVVPIGNDLIFACESNGNVSFGVEICEDLWVPVPPSSLLAQAGATLLFNPSASNELVGKADYRRQLVGSQSASCVAGYVYAGCNTGESTTDVVFGGHSLIAENGQLLAESERFTHESRMITADIDLPRIQYSRTVMGTFRAGKGGRNYRELLYVSPVRENSQRELKRTVGVNPFVPGNPLQREERCQEILSIQTSGLMKRIRHIGTKQAVIGISGGLDSTLALLVAVRAMELLGRPASDVLAVTMPGFGTTNRTYDNAVGLIKALGASLQVVDIKAACLQHFEDIGHDKDVHDLTYENVQARERTQILMDLANKNGGIVIGTGDLSELALGWCTYNGDHMSMYSVNSGIPKTLIQYVVAWYADHEADETVGKFLYSIIETGISPELLPPSATGEIVQLTENILGPYIVHDFFLYYMLRTGASPGKMLYLAQHAFGEAYPKEQLVAWLKVFVTRFFTQQFKRSCLPDGPKVGTVSLSPRGDWRMPSDASAALWLREIEEL